MSTPKPTRAIKAWAVVGRDGEFIPPFDAECCWIEFARTKKIALGYCDKGERVIPVLITPLTPEAKREREEMIADIAGILLALFIGWGWRYIQEDNRWIRWNHSQNLPTNWRPWGGDYPDAAMKGRK